MTTAILDIIPPGSEGYGGIYLGKFERLGLVVHKDFLDRNKRLTNLEYTFDQAIQILNNLGKHWYLPTKYELKFVLENNYFSKNNLKYISGSIFWTSTPNTAKQFDGEWKTFCVGYLWNNKIVFQERLSVDTCSILPVTYVFV